jgi:uncharacterized protein YwgA
MSEIFSPQERTLLLVLKCFNGQIRGIKRLQKLIFLCQHKGAIADEGKFIFAPYLRGPFSTDCMDILAELSQEGYVQIRRISDKRCHGYHAVQLTEKGRGAAELIRTSEETKVLLEQYRGMNTDSLTKASYEEFYRSIRPTMLYIDTQAIDEVTCYPSSPHWRSNIGERIKLSVPIGRTAALDERDVGKLERIRDTAAVFTSTKQILSDWRVRKLVPGCVIRTYGIFHDIKHAPLGLIGRFSHSVTPTQDNVIEAAVDAFGKIFFVDDGATTLMSYVVELCGEVGVSAARLVINALYILGYEVLDRVAEEEDTFEKNKMNQNDRLGFRRGDENFDVSSMFT